MDNQPERSVPERVADDLLIGARAIGVELGVNPDAVYHLTRTKRLPITHLGRNLIASRKKLRRAVATLTTAGTAIDSDTSTAA
jgi:hypothetical protein